jgi:hypothetical protein
MMDFNEKINSPENSIKTSELSFEKRLKLQKDILKIINLKDCIFSKKDDGKLQEIKQKLDELIEELEKIEKSESLDEIELKNKNNITLSLSQDIKDLKDIFMNENIRIIDIKNISRKIKNKLNLL